MNLACTNSFRFKQKEEIAELAIIHPMLLFIFADFNLYCYERNLPVVVTRAVDHNIDGVSVSNTHREGRAIDMSVKGWDHTTILHTVEFFNEKYREYGAISSSDGIPRLFVYHDVGLGRHFHMQIRYIKRKED